MLVTKFSNPESSCPEAKRVGRMRAQPRKKAALSMVAPTVTEANTTRDETRRLYL